MRLRALLVLGVRAEGVLGGPHLLVREARGGRELDLLLLRRVRAQHVPVEPLL